MKFFIRLILFITTLYTLIPVQAMNKAFKNKNINKVFLNKAFSTATSSSTPITKNNAFTTREDLSGVQWQFPVEPPQKKPNFTVKNIPKEDYFKKNAPDQQKRNYMTGRSPFSKSTGFARDLFRSYSTKPPVDPHAGKALFDMLKDLNVDERKRHHREFARMYFENGTHPNEERMKELNTAMEDLKADRQSTWSASTGSSHRNDYSKPKREPKTYHEPKTYSSSSNEPRISSKDARNVLTECLRVPKDSFYVNITTNDDFTITVNINYLVGLMQTSVLERPFLTISYKSELQQNINDLLTNSLANNSYNDLKNKIFPFISKFLLKYHPARRIKPDDLEKFFKGYRSILHKGWYSGNGIFYNRFNVRKKEFNPIAELYFFLTADAILVKPEYRKFPITIVEFERFLQSLYTQETESYGSASINFPMVFNQNFYDFAGYLEKTTAPSPWWKIW